MEYISRLDTSGAHLQTQKCMKNTAESRQEYLTSGREHTDPRKTRQDEESRGKNRSVSRIGPALGGWGS